MKLIIDVAYDYLNEKKEATFEEIFEACKSELSERWAESFPKLSESKINTKKMGELFTYLSTDGRFIVVNDTQWGLITNYPHSEVVKMRVNVTENNE